MYISIMRPLFMNSVEEWESIQQMHLARVKIIGYISLIPRFLNQLFKLKEEPHIVMFHHEEARPRMLLK
jgi:hypothetical protein